MHFSRIRALREAHSRTQQEIAELLHVGRTVYRRYETGQREIPVWAVIQLAAYYEVTTDYLLGLTERHV